MKEIVYHYTDAEGLLGIFRTGCKWATHISYLNDSQEYKYSKGLYRKTLESISKDAQLELVWQQFANAALIYLERLEESTSPLNSRFNYFVSSFSAKDDDLSQWRAYGGSGARFCIGFALLNF